jgi:hypothetical protein
MRSIALKKYSAEKNRVGREPEPQVFFLRPGKDKFQAAGLDFRACERKGGTADKTSRNEIRVAHVHYAKFPLVEIDVPVNQI